MIRSKKFLRRILFPQNPFDLVRNFLSLLSLLALFKYATNHTYSAALNLVILNYDSLVSKFLGPIRPICELISNYASIFFPWRISLQPHWKHIFVLMGVYFSSRVGSNYRAGLKGTAAFRLLWGIIVGLFSSSVAGSFYVRIGHYWSNAAIGLASVAGMLMYEIIINVWYATFFRKMQAELHGRNVRKWPSEFIALSISDFSRAFFASSIVLIGLIPKFIRTIPLSGLIMLGSVMFFYGCFWLFWAWKQTLYTSGAFDEVKYWKNTDAVVGAMMVSIFLWAATTVVVDTGAKIIFGA